MKIFLILLFVSSCGQVGVKTQQDTYKGTTLPEWTSDPEKGCEESDELCASGEGHSAQSADAHALKSLASIFETKVSSEFSHFQISKQDQSMLGDVQESTASNIKEEVNQLLEGITFKKRHKQGKIHYVLASLNKRTVGKKLGDAIKDIDAEISALWKSKKRTSYRKLLKNYFLRQQYADRLLLITERSPASSVELKDILNWFHQKIPSEVVSIEGDVPDWFEDQMKTLLTEAKYVISPNSSQKLVCKFDKKEEFIKVQGFSKWSILVTVTHTENSKNLGTFSENYVATGRSVTDAELKLKDTILKDVETKISSLNLD